MGHHDHLALAFGIKFLTSEEELQQEKSLVAVLQAVLHHSLSQQLFVDHKLVHPQAVHGPKMSSGCNHSSDAFHGISLTKVTAAKRVKYIRAKNTLQRPSNLLPC